MASFTDAGLPATLVSELARRGITTPFAIQAAALPDALAGENLLGRARTGSGKTLGFGLPMLARLAAGNTRTQPGRPRGLVLVPTRELAQQARDVLGPLGRTVRLRVTTVYGGVSISRQIEALRRGADIVVATPGRLTDLYNRGALTLDAIETVVLDEADHMCDLGFLPQVRTLLDLVGPGAQHLLFSATLDKDVEVLVREYLPNPVLVAVEPEAGGEIALARHAFEAADAGERTRLITALAGGLGRTLVFGNTQHGVERLAKQLTQAGVPALPLHGGMSQGARSRTLKAFSDEGARVVVATDVAARGIHVDGVSLVVHSGPALDAKTHQHRCGRTARAGASGTTVIVSVPEERRAVTALLRASGAGSSGAGAPGTAGSAGSAGSPGAGGAGGASRVEPLSADDPRIVDLVGPSAPRVEYVPGQPLLPPPPAAPGRGRAPRRAPGRGAPGGSERRDGRREGRRDIPGQRDGHGERRPRRLTPR